ncbi:MAG: DnaJ family molecular chaperone [Bdellovibrionales bacterium]
MVAKTADAQWKGGGPVPGTRSAVRDTRWRGKALGGAAGLLVGGPLGAIAGAAAGHVYDKYHKAFAALVDVQRAANAPEPVRRAKDPYNTLGVRRSASDADIKHAYRMMLRLYHPDAVMANGGDEDDIEAATERMAAINHAYDDIKQQRGWN